MDIVKISEIHFNSLVFWNEVKFEFLTMPNSMICWSSDLFEYYWDRPPYKLILQTLGEEFIKEKELSSKFSIGNIYLFIFFDSDWDSEKKRIENIDIRIKFIQWNIDRIIKQTKH